MKWNLILILKEFLGTFLMIFLILITTINFDNKDEDNKYLGKNICIFFSILWSLNFFTNKNSNNNPNFNPLITTLISWKEKSIYEFLNEDFLICISQFCGSSIAIFFISILYDINKLILFNSKNFYEKSKFENIIIYEIISSFIICFVVLLSKKYNKNIIVNFSLTYICLKMCGSAFNSGIMNPAFILGLKLNLILKGGNSDKIEFLIYANMAGILINLFIFNIIDEFEKEIKDDIKINNL